MPKLKVLTLAAALGLAIGAASAQQAAAQGASTTQPTLAPRSQAVAPPAAQSSRAAAGNRGAEQIPENVTARRQEIDAKAKTTLDMLLAQHESAAKLFDQAAGYAVFTVTKAGFFVTGASGTGVAVDKKTGHRTYMRMGSGGIGIGLGAQRYSLVILFQGQEQIDRFVRGGFNAKTTAEAAAGQAGAAASSSFVQGIAIYQLTSKGLMAQADVSGTRFWPINELN
ncbi:MAG TPA: YSC84-related protein [Gammaproteobacteria bacterium]|nr:YSC84-related protein [Gammaproteobacteria bacterium]